MERPSASLAFLFGLLLLLTALPAASGERVRIGIYENSPKVSYTEACKPEGIFVDLIEAIAEKEDWELEYVPGTWSEGLERLAAGPNDPMPGGALAPPRARTPPLPRGTGGARG